MTASVLLVDDEQAIRFSFSKYLTKAGFAITEAASLNEARQALHSKRLDAVLLDLSLPDGNGLDWIKELRELHPDLPIVVITGVGDIPSAVEAMRRGADHFLTKPVNMSDLEVFLNKSLELGSLRKKNFANGRLTKSSEPFFGRSAAMKEVLDLLKIASENESTVLLHGETGTGKGVFAKWIYEHSPRANMPFVEVNCSSLRGELLSNELFGHVRGAYTSASETTQGLLDVADGGTLFLDEIGDMEVGAQAQFLKVLEEKRYRRLGDIHERRSEFRLICATNRNLLEDVQEGSFRKDLYFRINVIPIEVPALRNRADDLPLLIEHILSLSGASKIEMSEAAMQKLKSYSWPGNIRELRNVIERAILLAGSGKRLEPKHFPGMDAHPLVQSDPHASEQLKQIRDMLEKFKGDKEKAAKALGISRATLYRKLK